jgi:Ca2+-binding RTX toxin-like protein
MGMFWSPRATHSRSRPRPTKRGRKMGVEKLESREVFAALTATLNGTILSVFDGATTTDYDTTVATAVALNGGGNGTMKVTGDAANNTFVVNGPSVSVGLVKLSLTGVNGLYLDGGGGVDTYAFDADTSITPNIGIVTIKNTPSAGTLDFSTTSTSINVNLSQSKNIVTGGLTIKYDAGTLIRRVIGGSGSDCITGDANINLLFGGGGNDKLNGLGGDDTLVGQAGNDTLTGGEGFDNYVFQADTQLGTDTIIESSLASSWCGTSASAPLGENGLDFTATTNTLVTVDLRQKVNVVNQFLTIINKSGPGSIYAVRGGQAGNVINGDDYKNILTGGASDDLLIGNGGDDGINGALGRDTLRGSDGNDTLIGADGNDTFEGGAGDDNLSGGGGDNRFIFAANTQLGTDSITDAGMKSALDFAQTTSDIKVNLGLKTKQVVNANLSLILGTATPLYGLAGGSGNDLLIGNAFDNVIVGNSGNDTIRAMGGFDQVNGNDGDDTLDGGAAKDILLGSAGNDILLGGDGDDILNGGDGDDILIGGTGIDTLVGGFNNDILIGASTIYGENQIKAIRSKWIAGLAISFDAAVQSVTTGTNPLDGASIVDDAAADKVFGNATSLEVAPGAKDLFFAALNDVLKDELANYDVTIVV